MTAGGVTSNAVTFTVNAATFTPIRINTGGGAYTDSMGNHWSADSNYSGGNELSTTNTISGTPDPARYQNWWAANATTPLTYTFNSIPNGARTVILDFAGVQATAAGQRVLNAAINGVTVLSNFDIFQTAGSEYCLGGDVSDYGHDRPDRHSVH